jgi:hypothetical protein
MTDSTLTRSQILVDKIKQKIHNPSAPHYVSVSDSVLTFLIEEMSYVDNDGKRVIAVDDINNLREELWWPEIQKILTSRNLK